jgi:uncharacterized protein YprB with RNaseH-like and TPR domain
MISEELRARIALLHRGAMLRPACTFSARSPHLESLVPGDIVHDAEGKFYRIRRAVTDVQANGLAQLACDYFPGSDTACDLPHPDLDAFAQAFPARALFLDLETCGFSGAPLFLIGMLRHMNGELIVEQLLARDYAEEPAVLRHLWQALGQYDVLVTFNGKSFDWPFILDRSIAHRLAPPGKRGRERDNGPRDVAVECSTAPPHRVPPTHCDLLHLARRYWKTKHGLPNCRLQTLELALCGRRRGEDIPGYLIGDVYHRFVRSGDARQVEQVLHHNAVDLITLAQLALLMIRDLANDRGVGRD